MKRITKILSIAMMVSLASCGQNAETNLASTVPVEQEIIDIDRLVKEQLNSGATVEECTEVVAERMEQNDRLQGVEYVMAPDYKKLAEEKCSQDIKRGLLDSKISVLEEQMKPTDCGWDVESDDEKSKASRKALEKAMEGHLE